MFLKCDDRRYENMFLLFLAYLLTGAGDKIEVNYVGW